jgi:succinate dehydrogenase/fumarate reductase cytochrome b subunit
MIKSIHYFSGITITIFVMAHLLNHLLVLHSEALHVTFMHSARKIYRHPVMETILLIAVLTQIISGIRLVAAKWSTATELFDWLHLLSGLYLALFLIVHVTAVLIGRYKLHLDTNLYYGAGVMNMHPQKLIFIPYYALAILSFFTHIASVHRIKMQELLPLDKVEQHSWIIIGTGMLITFLIVGRMSRIDLPKEFTNSSSQEINSN